MRRRPTFPQWLFGDGTKESAEFSGGGSLSPAEPHTEQRRHLDHGERPPIRGVRGCHGGSVRELTVSIGEMEGEEPYMLHEAFDGARLSGWAVAPSSSGAAWRSRGDSPARSACGPTVRSLSINDPESADTAVVDRWDADGALYASLGSRPHREVIVTQHRYGPSSIPRDGCRLARYRCHGVSIV